MPILKLIHYFHIINISLFFFLYSFSFAQSNMPIQWQSCFGGTENDYATDMVETENGYLVIGRVSSDDGDITNFHGIKDIWIASIDSLGILLWEKCYGGSQTDNQGRIIKGSEGSYYFCGATGSNDGDIQSGNHGDYDAWVVKIDETGEIIWEKCYGGSGREEGPSLKLLNNGNILISCKSTSDDGDLPNHYHAFDAWLFVISPEGEIIENAVFGNELHNSVHDAIETQDGGYFFTCYATSTEGMVEGTYHGGQTDVWVVKLDEDMNIEWQKLYGGSETDYGTTGILELSNGYLFLALTDSNDGDVSGFNGGFSDIWAVKIDFEGNIIWQKCLGGSDSEFAGDVFQTEDGGYVIFGETNSNNGDVSGNNSWVNRADIWMVKLNEDGEIIWQECYGGYGNERIYSGSLKKSDHNWVIAGRTDNNSFDVSCDLNNYKEDFWVFEIKDPTVSIAKENINEQGIIVYPNPAKNYVVFELGISSINSEILHLGMNLGEDRINLPAIIITNTFGQEVTKLKVKTEKTVWDTSPFRRGVYFYRLELCGKVISGKLTLI